MRLAHGLRLRRAWPKTAVSGLSLKVKGGVLTPEEELRTVQRLRDQFPSPYRIRFDPNAAWSVETSLRILPHMAEYDLECAEDPTWNLEGRLGENL